MRGGRLGGPAALVVALLLLPGLSMASGPASPPAAGASTTVVKIVQNPTVILEGSAITVSLELSDAANVHQVYFTFCQLTNSLCYLPVTMTAGSGNWFSGTTLPMSGYHGMNVGVRAGYNITIVYNDNTNFTEPSLPNAFGNLTVSQTITGEYVYAIIVSNPLYSLSGRVLDPASGAGVAGATVSLTGGTSVPPATTDSTGAYTFTGLSDGTYTVSAEATSHGSASASVTIGGHDAFENLTLSPMGGGGAGGGGSSGGIHLLGMSTLDSILVVGVAVLAVVILGVALLVSRSRRPVASSSSAAPATPSDASVTQKPG